MIEFTEKELDVLLQVFNVADEYCFNNLDKEDQSIYWQVFEKINKEKLEI